MAMANISGLASQIERRQELLPFLEDVLTDFGLMHAFRSRPAYERESYVSQITAAESPDARDERIAQMLDELATIREALSYSEASGGKY